MSANPLVPNAIGESKYPALSNTELGITAHAGGGQTSATKLTAQANIVTVVATDNDSVKLPKIIQTPGQFGSVGTIIFVGNADSAQSMQVFGASPDTINDVATGTGVAVAAGVNVWFVATGYTQSTDVGKWRMTNSQAASVAAITSGTISGVAMTSSTIDSTPIGQTTPASGKFTVLVGTSAATLQSLAVSGVVSVAGSATFANQVTVSGLAVSAAISVGGSGTVASNFAIGGVGTVSGNFFPCATAGNLFGAHGASGVAQIAAFTTISTSAGVTGTVGFTATQAALIITNLNALTDWAKNSGFSA